MKKEGEHYNKKYEEVLEQLNASRNGLSDEEAGKRLQKYGVNTIEDNKKVNPLKLLFEKFNSILIYVLFITAIISYYLGHMVEFYAILAIIAFTVLLSFIHEYRAEKSVEALASLTAKKVEVIRNGKKKEELAENLVPGDVVVLKSGLIVPADLRVIESHSLSVNESILTGESVPKGKVTNPLKGKLQVPDRENMAFSGTSVMNGSGLGVVTETAFDTEIGKISETLKSIKQEKTPLQKKVDGMSTKISYIVIGIAVLALAILLSRGEDINTALLLVAALAVAGIPEGFPLALTMALSSGVKKMADSNAIIKDMGSVETLGTTTVICTDKTGTLTQNKMLVEKLNLGYGDVSVEGKPYHSEAEFEMEGKKISKENLAKSKEFYKTAILCNDSEIYKEKNNWKLTGDPTEGALLSLARSTGFDDEGIRDRAEKLYEEPFDSAKKYMVVVAKEGNEIKSYLKGAVEKVLAKCLYVDKGGKEVKLTKKEKERIEEKMNEYSSKALRVLALASKKTGKDYKKNSKTGYVFRGLVGIKDPVREEVLDSIKQCKTAGVRTIMVTGDHKNTAKAIGEQLGLITNEYYKVIGGEEIDNMSDGELDKAMPNVAIFSRTTPEHKYRIVKSLQRHGEITAMTGDGVNDAPALKKADIGVSMGKEGTDVARESSNIVLTDDAFSSIVEAVRQGRTIYNNIQRFTYYLLTVNAAEVGIILLAVLFNLVTPLTALMILFINVVISSFPALGLAVEPTKEKIMHYLPRSPKEKLLSSYIMQKITVVLPFLILGGLGLFLWELNLGSGDVDKARTLVFATLITGELLHAFNARSLHTTIFKKELLGNKYFYGALAMAVVLVVTSIYLPAANTLFGTVPLKGLEWMIILLISSLVVFASERTKLLIKSEIDEQTKVQGSKLKFE